MKTKEKCSGCDEICGKETADYIEEFSPHRISLLHFEEDCEEIFDADEKDAFVPR